MDAYNGWEWFYLDDQAENVGPFTTEELASFWQEGGINDETYSKLNDDDFRKSPQHFVMREKELPLVSLAWQARQSRQARLLPKHRSLV